MEKVLAQILLVFLALHLLNAAPQAISAEECPLPTVTEIKVENALFPPSLKPPGSSNQLFLGGAGVRRIQIGGKYSNFTALGVYLESSAVPTLAVKWKGKTVDTTEFEFYNDIVAGSFEKFTQVTMLMPLTGPQFSEAVSGQCVPYMKYNGIYNEPEQKAVEKFNEIFKDETFPPGTSILISYSPHGAITFSFSKDGSLPEIGNAVIENEALTEVMLLFIMSTDGEAKVSLAERLSELFVKNDCKVAGDEKIEN